MELFNEILDKIDSIVWGIPTIALILVTGIILTFRLRGLQCRKLGLGFKSLFKKSEGGKGEVHLQHFVPHFRKLSEQETLLV